jgi:hypothetical protein
VSRQIHLTDLAADEQLLDRLGSRSDAGSEPVALLLAALARHADSPLRPGPAPRRFTRRRTLTALTALVVGASGAGVAAAVSQPHAWLTREPRVAALDAMPRPALTQPGLSQLTLSAPPAPLVANDGYDLVRDAAGQIVLLPPKVVVEVAPTPAPAPAPVVAVAAEPVSDQAVAALGADAQAAPTSSGGTNEPPTLASASGPAKTKPAPAEQPGKSKPQGPVSPASTDEILTLASQPAAAQPRGQSIAAALRPSTPGTESGPGVPARPEKPERARDPQKPEQADQAAKPDQANDPGKPDQANDPGKPDQANDPGKPEHVGDSDHPGKPDLPAVPGEPAEPAVPADPGKPAASDKPSGPAESSEADSREKPDTPAPAMPATPPQPATPSAEQRPAAAEAPAAVELPSVPAAPVVAPPAAPAS